MTDKECFIIMPITTPAEFIHAYRDDREHFLHVMKCIFVPAIEKAGFKPILPVIQGSEIIHGEIISNIESADLVLCDMSILNPNVFFELGIRTALNKPVCLVKDNLIEKVPFDTNIINYHLYSPDLSSWVVKDGIEKLASHIKECFSRSNNCNSLWRYFGLKSIATPPEKLNKEDGEFEYLNMQVEAIRKQLSEQSKVTQFSQDKNKEWIYYKDEQYKLNKFHLDEIINNLFSSYVINVNQIIPHKDSLGTTFIIAYEGDKHLPEELITELRNVEQKYGIKLDWVGS